MKLEFSTIKKGILSVLSANAINKVITMLSSMIITRILTQDDYGIWSYVLNIYSYLTLVTGIGLISGAMQFGAENKGEGRAYSFYKYCIEKGFVFDLLLVFVACWIFAFSNISVNEAKPFLIAYLPYLLLEFIFSIGNTILRSKNRITEYSRVLNINTVLLTSGMCIGAFFGVQGVVIGRYIAEIITIVVLVWLLRKKIGDIKHASKLEKTEKKKLWHYSLFTGASAALNVLVYSLDITLIAVLIQSTKDISIYKVGTLIPNALQFIPVSIVTAVFPSIIYNKDNIIWVRNIVKKLYLLLGGFNFLMTIAVLLFAPNIIFIISGEQYVDSAPVLRILMLGYFFSGTFRTLSVNLLASFRRVYYGLFISISSCVADVIFNIILISGYGTIGAAYATLLVDIITAVLSFGYVLLLLKRGTINELR